MSLRYETLFLDFHGTFTSNRGRLAHALQGAYEDVTGEKKLPQNIFQDVLHRPEGVSVTQAIDTVINGQLHPDAKAELMRMYREYNDGIYVPKHRYLIRRLHELGVLCVIVTNGQEERVRQTIESKHWGLGDYVDAIYGKGPGGFLEGKRSKPHKDALETVIDDLRIKGHVIKRHRTLMVGDYITDIEAGNSAGMHTAFLVTGPNQNPSNFEVKPTYFLLDMLGAKPASDWLEREDVYPVRDLTKIVRGEV